MPQHSNLEIYHWMSFVACVDASKLLNKKKKGFIASQRLSQFYQLLHYLWTVTVVSAISSRQTSLDCHSCLLFQLLTSTSKHFEIPGKTHFPLCCNYFIHPGFIKNINDWFNLLHNAANFLTYNSLTSNEKTLGKVEQKATVGQSKQGILVLLHCLKVVRHHEVLLHFSVSLFLHKLKAFSRTVQTVSVMKIQKELLFFSTLYFHHWILNSFRLLQKKLWPATVGKWKTKTGYQPQGQ